MCVFSMDLFLCLGFPKLRNFHHTSYNDRLSEAWKLYHLNGVGRLKPKTKEDVEVLQSNQFRRKRSR